MKILFLIGDGFGIGGTIRTTFNLAGGLARRGHDVEVLSCARRRDVPLLPFDPMIRLTALVEKRPQHPDFPAEDPLLGRPPRVFPRGDFRYADFDLLMEERARRYLRVSDADVVIATRAGLIAWVAAFAPERMIRIGQEHLTRRAYRGSMRLTMAQHYHRLDAFVTVSARDAEDYRSALRLRDTRLIFIPNGVPQPRVTPSDGRHKLVVAAGRLVESKRYDVLIRAFATVVEKRPDWRLRIYGTGRTAPQLRRLVIELGLHNNVLLMGRYSPIESEWAKGAIAAVPSDREPFGMTLVEAMRCGVPVVSTDAPYGPGEILADGVDGRLTPVGDPDAMALALLELIDDPSRRQRMAEAALANSVRFDVDGIAQRYEQLFAELAVDRAGRTRRWRDRFQRWRRGTAAWRGVDEPVTALGPVPSASRPVADCVSRPDGSVTLRLPTAPLPARPTLSWRRLAGTGPASVTLPAARRDGGHLTTTVAPEAVPEGSWQLRVADATGEAAPVLAGPVLAAPVLAGLRDTRTLLDPALTQTAGEATGVRVLLPYRDGSGFFCLRVWHRAVHCEVGEVQVDDERVRFSGRLIGARFTAAQPAVELRHRDGRSARRVPVQRVGEAAFQVDIGCDELAAGGPGGWDVWLCHGDDAPAVRAGRFLDDVLDKRTAYAYPAATVGARRIQPGFTAQNEFSLEVDDAG